MFQFQVVILSALCSLVRSSGVGHLGQLAPAPIVAAASSQYFERTFNRLVAAHPVLEPVIPVAPAPPVFVEAVAKAVPAVKVTPAQNVPANPNVAIAIATAHAAAPVATILLPPYPFGPPPTIGFVPPFPPVNVPDENKKESTTRPTTKFEVTTPREPEATTPLPSSSNTDNSFAQPLPSNQNVNFNQLYGPPQPPQAARPQKLRTSVEVVPVPLAYIAPPPLYHTHEHLQAHSHAHTHAHAHSHSHVHVKPIRYVHTFIPSRAKIIIRPVSAPLRIRPVRLVARVPAPSRISAPQNVLRSRSGDARDTEPTTFSPFNRPVTKPPRQ